MNGEIQTVQRVFLKYCAIFLWLVVRTVCALGSRDLTRWQDR